MGSKIRILQKLKKKKKKGFCEIGLNWFHLRIPQNLVCNLHIYISISRFDSSSKSEAQYFSAMQQLENNQNLNKQWAYWHNEDSYL